MTAIRLRVLPALLPVGGKAVEMQATDEYIQWRQEGDDWLDLILISDITGPASLGVEMQSNGSYIQYRAIGDTDWIDLAPVAAIIDGNKGDITASDEGGTWLLNAGAVDANKIGAGNAQGVRELLYAGTGEFFAADGALIQRIADRILLGAEAAESNGENPSSDTGDWPWALRPASLAASQFGSISTIGHTGVFGGSKSSSNGVDGSQGTIGGYFMAWNDHVGTVSAYGFYGEAFREAGAGITHGGEVDIVNRGNVVDVYPFLANPAGLSEGLRIASGGEDAGANAASVGLSFIANGQPFRTGINFQEGSVETNVAIGMQAEYQHVWFGAGGGTARRIDNGAAATFFNGAGVEKGSIGLDDALGVLRIDAKSAGTMHFAGQSVVGTAGSLLGYWVIEINGVPAKITLSNP